MRLETKRIIIGILGFLFLLSLVFVQAMEVVRKRAEGDRMGAHYVVPVSSSECVRCHQDTTPGIVDHWKGSSHARKAIGCVECHQAEKSEADAFDHYGSIIATVVTPLDCKRCHQKEYEQFSHSHHAAGGNILHSLDNFLAETVEGSRVPFNPHSPTPGRSDLNGPVNGMASAFSGCQQCHGSKVALKSTDGNMLTFEDFKPDASGKPTNQSAIDKILKEKGRPLYHPSTYPNHGIGRLNLDGSRGSCSACHSRHDFSARRARQPENCGNCHLGPDHPQKEIYEESKHGVAYRDLKDFMNLNSPRWVLGKDYAQAPTCATCHMSGNTRNKGEITHDPGERISWTNRPPVSLWMDTDEKHSVVTETDPVKRAALIKDTGEARRGRMKTVCSHCHTGDYVDAFYKQYDDFIVLYNEKFAKPGQAIMKALRDQELISKTEFDEEIEWTWFYLWHHEGRRARHGVAMMAPDYTHWHGMFEVADRFYMQMIPQAREIAHQADTAGKKTQAEAVRKVIDGILTRPEHQWFEKDRPKAGRPRP
jgi:hypothetical protein